MTQKNGIVAVMPTHSCFSLVVKAERSEVSSSHTLLGLNFIMSDSLIPILSIFSSCFIVMVISHATRGLELEYIGGSEITL